MVKVLFIASSLDYSGPTRQLTYLAANLPRHRFAVRVGVLGPQTPWCDQLRTAGVQIDVLGWARPVDYVQVFNPFSDLNVMVARQRPDVIHAWGLGAAWAMVLGGTCRPGRLRVSAALTEARTSWPTRCLLRRVGRVLALGVAEEERYRRLGVPEKRLGAVAAGVPVPATLPAPARLPGLPDQARVVLCLGPLQPHKGHREAAWSMDILHLACPGTHLVIVGAGPASAAVRRLMDSNRLHDHVHLLGPVADVAPWLARAAVVWVPSLRPGGRFAVLEAMAAARPVVASHLPELAELVVEGQTGYLVRPGDKVELARQTRLLLDYPELARQMGEAGQQRAREAFALPALLERTASWLEEGIR